MSEPSLMDIIQLHERKWGERQYSGRPSLHELMSSLIVAVWKSGPRIMLSAHQQADQLNEIIFAIVTGKDPNPQDRKLIKVFANRQPVPFTVRIVSSSVEASKPTNAQTEQDTANKFVFWRKGAGPVGFPASRIKPRVKEVLPIPEGSPAFLTPQILSGRNDDLLEGRHVSLLPGREAPVLKLNKAR